MQQPTPLLYKLFTRITMTMMMIIVLMACKDKSPKIIPNQPTFKHILTDTSNNQRAQRELYQLAHYNSICNAIGIRKLYDGADSLEVRLWRQFSVFGMKADEEIYSLKIIDSTILLTFYRIYCTNYDYGNEKHRKWDAFADARIDSFTAISKTFPLNITGKLNLQSLWDLQTASALNISDSIGFLDGTTTSIELASASKYKLISYHVAYAYFQKTGLQPIKDYMDQSESLIHLFESNKIYDLIWE